MTRFFEFLSRYNRREQTMLLVGGLAICLYLLWKVLLVPMQDWRDQQLQNNASATQALGRVKILSARLEQYRSAAEGAGQQDANISRLIDASLQDNGLSMSGFQPGTGGEVRVRFDQVPYERLMQWLYDIEYQHDIGVTDLSMAATSEQGLVTVNIRLQKN